MLDLKRRNLLKGIGATGLTTGLAGCSSSDNDFFPDTFEAAAYGLTASSARRIGFSGAFVDVPSITKNAPLVGEVSIISKLILYLTGDRAPLSVFSTPDASILGQSLNPLATLGLRNILLRATEFAVVQRLLASLDAVEDEFPEWEREPELVRELTAPVLGSEAAVKLFVAQLQQTVVLLALARVTVGDDVVLVASGRSKELDGLRKGTEPMEAFSEEEVNAAIGEFTEVLPEIEAVDPERVKREMDGEQETEEGGSETRTPSETIDPQLQNCLDGLGLLAPRNPEFVSEYLRPTLDNAEILIDPTLEPIGDIRTSVLERSEEPTVNLAFVPADTVGALLDADALMTLPSDLFLPLIIQAGLGPVISPDGDLMGGNLTSTPASSLFEGPVLLVAFQPSGACRPALEILFRRFLEAWKRLFNLPEDPCTEHRLALYMKLSDNGVTVAPPSIPEIPPEGVPERGEEGYEEFRQEVSNWLDCSALVHGEAQYEDPCCDPVSRRTSITSDPISSSCLTSAATGVTLGRYSGDPKKEVREMITTYENVLSEFCSDCEVTVTQAGNVTPSTTDYPRVTDVDNVTFGAATLTLPGRNTGISLLTLRTISFDISWRCEEVLRLRVPVNVSLKCDGSEYSCSGITLTSHFRRSSSGQEHTKECEFKDITIPQIHKTRMPAVYSLDELLERVPKKHRARTRVNIKRSLATEACKTRCISCP